MIKPDKIPAYNPRSLYPKPSCERSESRGSEDARPGPVVHGEEEQLLSAQEKQEEEQQLQEQEQGERKENDAPIVEDVKEGDSDNEDDDDDDDGGTEEDLSSQLQTQAAQQFRIPDFSNMMAKVDVSSSATTGEDEEEVDESGLEPRDIDLVMTGWCV
ncbi:NAC domain [Musa troglodytarum]|uniref:NAC domain n=1 Tax=Musa troglodytarum TaxID=320322 RepID=A0A9E7G0D5_9LILI|nr:NAC domain [Musa troglodytarum]